MLRLRFGWKSALSLAALTLLLGFAFASRAPRAHGSATSERAAQTSRSPDVEATATRGHVLAARAVPPFVAPKFVSGAPQFTFLAVGDTGWPNHVLHEVATAMGNERDARGADVALLLGDNFYHDGVASVTDVQWRTTFEDAFPRERLPIPFLATLGNHDHSGNVRAQLDYTGPATRWTMPDRDYSRVFFVDGAELVEFFAVDTEPMAHTLGWFGTADETAWLGRALAKSHARWKIVFGHHPARSHGRHGDNARVAGDFEPLFARYGVDLYFAGHDHDQELTPMSVPTLQVVSGAGSHSEDVTCAKESLFVSAEPGFVWAGMTHDELWLVFVDRERHELFSHQLLKHRAPAVATK